MTLGPFSSTDLGYDHPGVFRTENYCYKKWNSRAEWIFFPKNLRASHISREIFRKSHREGSGHPGERYPSIGWREGHYDEWGRIGWRKIAEQAGVRVDFRPGLCRLPKPPKTVVVKSPYHAALLVLWFPEYPYTIWVVERRKRSVAEMIKYPQNHVVSARKRGGSTRRCLNSALRRRVVL